MKQISYLIIISIISFLTGCASPTGHESVDKYYMAEKNGSITADHMYLLLDPYCVGWDFSDKYGEDIFEPNQKQCIQYWKKYIDLYKAEFKLDPYASLSNYTYVRMNIVSQMSIDKSSVSIMNGITSDLYVHYNSDIAHAQYKLSSIWDYYSNRMKLAKLICDEESKEKYVASNNQCSAYGDYLYQHKQFQESYSYYTKMRIDETSDKYIYGKYFIPLILNHPEVMKGSNITFSLTKSLNYYVKYMVRVYHAYKDANREHPRGTRGWSSNYDFGVSNWEVDDFYNSSYNSKRKVAMYNEYLKLYDSYYVDKQTPKDIKLDKYKMRFIEFYKNKDYVKAFLNFDFYTKIGGKYSVNMLYYQAKALDNSGYINDINDELFSIPGAKTEYNKYLILAGKNSGVYNKMYYQDVLKRLAKLE